MKAECTECVPSPVPVPHLNIYSWLPKIKAGKGRNAKLEPSNPESTNGCVVTVGHFTVYDTDYGNVKDVG